jgi:hypothetical protein
VVRSHKSVPKHHTKLPKDPPQFPSKKKGTFLDFPFLWEQSFEFPVGAVATAGRLKGQRRYVRACGGSDRCCHQICHHQFEEESRWYRSWDSSYRFGIRVGWPCNAKRTACGAVLVFKSILVGNFGFEEFRHLVLAQSHHGSNNATHTLEQGG